MLPSSTELIYFHEVAQELHFSRAAKKLNVSQPSLSLAIQRLEKNLDVYLFIRHKQGVTLTRAGVELLHDVKQLLAQWGETCSRIKDVAQNIRGEVKIGCHSTLTPFMSTMVSGLLHQYPGMQIHFQHDLTAKIMEDILQGHLDIGITTDPYPYSDVIMQHVCDTVFTFWMSNKDNISYDLYSDEVVIICDPQLPSTQYLLKQLQNGRRSKPFRLSTMNRIEVIASMTAENCGVGILPNAFTERFFGDKLKKVPNAPEYKKPLYLAYRYENKQIAVVQVVLEAMRKLVKKAP